MMAFACGRCSECDGGRGHEFCIHVLGAPPTEGRKDDQAKPRMELLSRVALEGCAQVLAFGAKKYAADNWRAGMAWRRVIGAAMRHLQAFSDGEDADPESGLPHLDHLACCVMFLSEFQKKGRGTDDRFKPAAQGAPAAEVK